MSQCSELHSALMTEVIASAEGGGVQFKLVQLQNSKEDIKYSVHADPRTFSFSGPQRPDLLAHIGFQVCDCAFFDNKKCLANLVPPNFALPDFAKAFALAFEMLEKADRTLGTCGYFITNPDKNKSQNDGHTSPKSQKMKQSEDDKFFYTMSWIEGGSDKGWTFHYRPKHPPLSDEMEAAFKFLELKEFNQCPYFEFEPCYYRFFTFEKRGERFFDSNAEYVHRFFDAHGEKFSLGLEELLNIHSILLPSGFNFLPSVVKRRMPTIQDSVPPQRRPTKESSQGARPFQYDVAVSFAGTERKFAEKLSSLVRDAGYNVFYDDFYPEQLWGKDLVVFFDDIYQRKSRYCVPFISEEYISGEWTNVERRSALARMVKAKGDEYILPIMVEKVELPGLPSTIGYLELNKYGIDKIAQILIAKLKGQNPSISN